MMNNLDPILNEKWQRLTNRLKDLGGAVVALSGGVDSSLLAVAAHQTLAPHMLALTIRSEVESAELMESASDLARMFGIPHRFMDTPKLNDPEYVKNSPQRCYVCRTVDLKIINEIARETGLEHVLLGANLDDQGDYRPGLRAAAEQQAISPLAEAGLTKAEIRKLAHELGLPNWNLPSSPCLASRIPYGQPVTQEKLDQIAKGEEYLHGLGFNVVRVRHGGASVKIEVPPAEIGRLAEQREGLVGFFKQLGFKYVTLDLEGYRMGSLNEIL